MPPTEDGEDEQAGGEPTAKLPVDLPKALVEALPDEVRQVVLKAASFSGPLPPAPMFRGYEEVLPGAADRILKMAENQSAHRQEWEKSALRSRQKDFARRQGFGFILSLASLGCATYLAMEDQLAAPLVLMSLGLAGFVSNLIRALRRGLPDDDSDR